jgi:hypothetical protein
VSEGETAGGRLPDEAFVVRAGIMELGDLRDNVDDHYYRVLTEEQIEEWAMSVYCIPDQSAEYIARKAKKRNRKMCVSTVGEIRAVGYEVRSDWDEDGHSNIMFDEEPTDEDLLTVKDVFSDPVPNPGRPA